MGSLMNDPSSSEESFRSTSEQRLLRPHAINRNLSRPPQNNYKNPSTMDMDELCGCRDRPCQRSKKKWISLPCLCIAVGVCLLMWFINESSGTIKSFRNDLCTFKTGFEKDTQAKLKSIEQDTDRKLETIESLMQEIKTNQNTPGSIQVQGRSQAEANDGDKNIDVYQVVQEALAEYSADKTGRPDFALSSAGGKILSIGDSTESFNPSENSITFFGIPLGSYSYENGPTALIETGTLPGQCWAFRGSQGSVIIRLLGHVKISCVSIEHITKAISPTGQIDSAPKDFNIYGLPCSSNTKKDLLGQFIYDANGPAIQFFSVDGDGKSYEYVEFKVKSNHGNPIFTCVYRLRVHGVLDKP